MEQRFSKESVKFAITSIWQVVRDEIPGTIRVVSCYSIILFSKGLVEFHTVGGEKGKNVCKMIGLTYRKITFLYDLPL